IKSLIAGTFPHGHLWRWSSQLYMFWASLLLGALLIGSAKDIATLSTSLTTKPLSPFILTSIALTFIAATRRRPMRHRHQQNHLQSLQSLEVQQSVQRANAQRRI
ncbi:hypothetical protein J3B02_004096, partial [Coemansia erecta]